MAEKIQEGARPIGWRICSVVDHRGRITGKHRIVCPRCGYRKEFGSLRFYLPKFCENCGADMRGGRQNAQVDN